MSEAGYCVSCWRRCPGLDPEGYCLDANRAELAAFLAHEKQEIYVGLSADHVIAPERPEARMVILHTQRGFSGWEIVLDGAPVSGVHSAGTGNHLDPVGWVQFLTPGGMPGRTQRGTVEIRPRTPETESETVNATLGPATKIAGVDDWITCAGPHDWTLVGQVRSTDDTGGLAHWVEGPSGYVGRQSRFSWNDPGLRVIDPPTGEAADYSARNTFPPDPDRIVEIDPELIQAFRFQPRTLFDEAALEELAASIRDDGQKQPVRVRPAAPGSEQPYEAIAGERRIRACRLVGIPVRAIVVEIDDQAALIEATSENFQREGLSVMDTARNIRLLQEQCHLSQAKIGEIMGKRKQAWVSQHVRLLELPDTVQGYLDRGLLEPSHGTALLPLLTLNDPQRVIALADDAVREQWPSREVERRVATIREEELARNQPSLIDEEPASSVQDPTPTPIASLCGKCGCSTTAPVRPGLTTVLCDPCFGEWAAENLEPGDEAEAPETPSQAAAPATLPGCAHCGGAFNGGSTTEHAGQRYCHRPPCVSFLATLKTPVDAGAVAPVAETPIAAATPAPTPVESPAHVPPVETAPVAETPKPNALKSAEEIVQEKAGNTVPSTVGAAVLDGPVTMCMVLEDCVSWLRSDGLNVKTFLARIKSAAYSRGLDSASLLNSLENPHG